MWASTFPSCCWHKQRVVPSPLMFKGRHQRQIPQLELGECCSAVSINASNHILKNLLGFRSFGLELNSYHSFIHTKKVSRSWGGWKIEFEFLLSLRALASPETTLLLSLSIKILPFSSIKDVNEQIEKSELSYYYMKDVKESWLIKTMYSSLLLLKVNMVSLYRFLSWNGNWKWIILYYRVFSCGWEWHSAARAVLILDLLFI